MNRQQFAQKAFVRDGNKILVVRKSADDPHNPGRWEMPGGRMKFGEAVDEHLVREVLEETGLTVVPGRPFYIWQWVMSDITPDSDDSIQVIAVARECSLSGVESVASSLEDTDYISDMSWVGVGNLSNLDLIPSLRPAVDAYLAHGI
jgi:8-oxo-dGTP pyrophosphatase MutT (NUDIX family)